MTQSTPDRRTFPGALRLLLLAGFAPLALFAGCDVRAQTGETGAPAGPPPPPQVTVEIVETRSLVEYAELTGRIAAAEMVELRPRVSGHLESVLFQSGQIVEAGQVLFVIDPRWQQATLDGANAALAAAQARLGVTESEHERAKGLLARKAVSAEEVDARAARVLEERAAVASAVAARMSAALDLEFTQVRAPIRGRVSRALVTAGNFVSGIPSANTVLTTIVSQDPVHFYADLDEATFLRLDRALHGSAGNGNGNGNGDAPTDVTRVPVELRLGDEEGFPHRGHVESFDNQLDIASGTILLRATFANPDGALVSGLYAHARIPIGEPAPALLVDERAISTDQNQKYVLAIGANNIAEYRKVLLGSLEGGRRVIRSGLTATDRVIVTGLQKVRPGMPVEPKLAAPATHDPLPAGQ
jgi:RND family efflux transporter MFP subunit